MRGTIRKRGKNYYYTLDLPKVDGKRRQIERFGGLTYEDAENALRKAINELASKVDINGSIFALPEACLVIDMALPFCTMRALPAHQFIRRVPQCAISPPANLRSVVLMAPFNFQP